MTKAMVYGVGVGPGDPELLTLKAVRIMHACQVVAVPGNEATESLAYRVAVAAVPEIAEKELVALPSPMVRDSAQVEEAHAANARILETYVDDGRSVAFLTLGDPSIYSTFSYLRHALEKDGYPMTTISGVPSFCAAAARLDVSLAEGNEPLHIVPASQIAGPEACAEPGTYIIMKVGGCMTRLKKLLGEANLQAQAVERCGMEDERVYDSLQQIPDDVGYFSLVVARRA